MGYNVLVTETISEKGLSILKNDKNIHLDIINGMTENELKNIISDYDAIITRSGTRITSNLLENPGRLKIIGRAGVGLDNIDIEAASRKGVIVMNAPTGNTIAATELTMGHILSAARKIPEANNSLLEGKWDRKKFLGVQLHEKTLGIVGLGRIGSNVALRAKAFDMAIVAYDPYIKRTKADALGVRLIDKFEDLLAISDIVTFHTPLTNETYKMLSDKEMKFMKDGAIVINCARGGIIDEDGLLKALNSGKLFAAGIDVFEKEPPKDNPLLKISNVFFTPHIGANTFEGQKSVAVIIAEQVLSALKGENYINAVNIPFIKSQLSTYHRLYFELIEKIGKLAAQVTKGRIEKIEINLIGRHFEEDINEPVFDRPLNYQPFTIAGIKGFLEVILKDSVTYMSAPYLAQDRNITISETKEKQLEEYNNLIMMKIKTDTEEKEIGGTVLSDQVGRLTVLDKFHLDIIPQGIFLYFRNYDKPGVIGKVGTILGENSINIAGFGLSRHNEGKAMGFVSVDNSITKKTLDEILNINGIIEAKTIKF